jgi:predicted nucleotidyltransferase
MGVSGSVLVMLSTNFSDIDVIIYGSRNCRIVNDTIAKLLTEKKYLKPYKQDMLKARYRERVINCNIPFDDYAYHELRKTFQGYYQNRDFFIRYIKDWNEIKEQYGDKHYRNMGYAAITGLVTDDSEALFTPCTYLLDDVKTIKGKEYSPIKEVASFRGRFCQQAKAGEKITAQGKIEQVETSGQIHYRLLLGNTTDDFMVTTKT